MFVHAELSFALAYPKYLLLLLLIACLDVEGNQVEVPIAAFPNASCDYEVLMSEDPSYFDRYNASDRFFE